MLNICKTCVSFFCQSRRFAASFIPTDQSYGTDGADSHAVSLKIMLSLCRKSVLFSPIVHKHFHVSKTASNATYSLTDFEDGDALSHVYLSSFVSHISLYDSFPQEHGNIICFFLHSMRSSSAYFSDSHGRFLTNSICRDRKMPQLIRMPQGAVSNETAGDGKVVCSKYSLPLSILVASFPIPQFASQ